MRFCRSFAVLGAVLASACAESPVAPVHEAAPTFSVLENSIERSSVPAGSSQSSVLMATFLVEIKASGGDVVLGSQAASIPAFELTIWKDGVRVLLAIAQTSLYTVPSSGVVAFGSDHFKIPESNSVVVPVTFVFEGRTASGGPLSPGSYAAGIDAVNWSTVDGVLHKESTASALSLGWRTQAIVLP
ncbi:MAG: hypothetical protein JWN50_446 [Parcubacteria group bacterium]|nr:hypothetical protein [Parcubacteria group bacterium]